MFTNEFTVAAAFDDERAIVIPPAGAGAEIVTVPVVEVPA